METEKQTTTGGRAYGALLEISHANAEGRAPSPVAVKVLAEYFQRWVDEDGHRTFDQVLGFAAEGKGKAPFLEKLRQRSRDLFIGHLVAVLHAGGFTLEEAAELVSAAINRSTDARFNKQCREFGANPPSNGRKRAGQELEHLPRKSILRIFGDLGGAKWARFAGYFGECEERRQLQRLDRGDQDNLNFLTDLQFCSSLPFRSVDELRPVIPADALPKALAQRWRKK